MAILQIIPFDMLLSDASRFMAPLSFWAGLPRITDGISSVRLLMVADNLLPSDVLNGFQQVAVPQEELPHTMRWYRVLYEEFLRQSVQTTRFMKLYLTMKTRLSDEALIQLLGAYAIQARPLHEAVPLPFSRGQCAWNRLESEDGQKWALIRSRINQTGNAHPRMLHRLFALDFPVWCALDIFTHTPQEAASMLRRKELSALGERVQGEAMAEASDVRNAVGRLRYEINRVGAALHNMRFSVVVGANNNTELAERLEMVRGAAGLDMEGWESDVKGIQEALSADIPQKTDGSLLTSTGLCILTGSALGYRRRTDVDGILVGTDRNQAPVVINLFDNRNSSYNMVVLGQTGAGKTFSILLMMLRHLLMGVQLIIVDPQGNIDLSFLGENICHKAILGTSTASINILDRVQPELSSQIEGVVAVLSMLGITDNENPIQRAILDEVLMDIYQPLWEQTANTLSVAVPTLEAVEVRLQGISLERHRTPLVKEQAALLAYSMARYVKGSWAELFGRPSTVNFSLDHPVTIFDVSRLPKKQSGANMRAALLSILVSNVNQSIRRRRRAGDTVPIMFFVDEMGVLMRDDVIASHISEEYKTARSRRVAMIIADQDLPSLLGQKDERGFGHGVTMLANSLYRLIFLQAADQKAAVKEYFPNLPASMIESLPTLPQGTCLAQLPGDLLQVSMIPSAFEAAILSSRIQDKQKAREMMAQMAREAQMASEVIHAPLWDLEDNDNEEAEGEI